MNNLDYVVSELRKGNDVYLIDEYEELALHFTPKLTADKVYCKAASKWGGDEKIWDTSNEQVFATWLGADIVTEHEYISY